MMAGTLLLLGEAGYELHIMNIANGSCGSMTEDAATVIARRTAEAQAASAELGAVFHPPIANDPLSQYKPKHNPDRRRCGGAHRCALMPPPGQALANALFLLSPRPRHSVRWRTD
jgi:hypothetical protein